MAVIGRQRWKAYLASYRAIALSASVVLSCANRRAFCARLLPKPRAAWSAIWFQTIQIGAAPQNLPIAVSSAVRVALFSSPREWTSLKSAAYRGLVSAGGGAGRNWLALSSTNGVTCGVCVKPAAANAGGVSWYSPGPAPGVNAGGVPAAPSLA